MVKYNLLKPHAGPYFLLLSAQAAPISLKRGLLNMAVLGTSSHGDLFPPLALTSALNTGVFQLAPSMPTVSSVDSLVRLLLPERKKNVY